jgi:tetratricopeptide (TPR) repeat protein
LHDGLNLTIQDELRDPYSCVAKRLNTLVDSAKIPEDKLHHVIMRDMVQLAANIKATLENKAEAQDNQNTAGSQSRAKRIPIPSYMLAQIAERDGKFDEALRYARKALKSPSPEKAFELAFRAAGQLNDVEQINQLIAELEECYRSGNETGMFHNYAIDLIKTKHFNEANQILDLGLSLCEGKGNFDIEYYKINKAQIYLHQSKEVPEELKRELAVIAEKSSNPYARFGASIVLGNETQAAGEVPELMRRGSHSVDSLLSWPIMDVLSDAGRTQILAAIQNFYKLRPLGDGHNVKSRSLIQTSTP